MVLVIALPVLRVPADRGDHPAVLPAGHLLSLPTWPRCTPWAWTACWACRCRRRHRPGGLPTRRGAAAHRRRGLLPPLSMAVFGRYRGGLHPQGAGSWPAAGHRA
ncbi:hypothetical protein QJS66_19235 [Kocuria rhizophila]|nr:hypothetical protein QJS66_19235 [Kocuria rhizophila]